MMSSQRRAIALRERRSVEPLGRQDATTAFGSSIVDQKSASLMIDRFQMEGVLPDAEIKQLIREDVIESDSPILPKQIQPASLDLRLGDKAYRVRASFLPGKNDTVRNRIEKLKLYEFSLSEGAVLDPGAVYIIELKERANFSKTLGLQGRTNPKSSTGRLDVLTRVICDNGESFDTIDKSYDGPLYAEIAPRTFSIKVQEGSSLTQLRLHYNNRYLDSAELLSLHESARIIDQESPSVSEGGVILSVDLCSPDDGIVGYRARRHAAPIDIDKVSEYEVDDFWELIPSKHSRDSGLILDPQEFYILASKEKIQIPPGYAAEMVPVDPMMGEFRVHYAGFFDPGFGLCKAVLEIRSHEVPFLLEHGQPVGSLVFEKLAGKSVRNYGRQIGSHYQSQNLWLSKHFKRQ